MKLTQNQQAIIDSLTNEFNRINNESTKGSFNLININPLIDKTREIKENQRIAELDKQMWDKLAMDEAQRIAELLSEDLPFACVERYGKSNGHYDLPYITIQRGKGITGHHENHVCIQVTIVKEWVKQSHDCGYEKGIRLGYERYEHSYSNNRTIYNSIEELFEKSNIAEEIRIKIINKLI